MSKFEKTYCSECGCEFGPGDSGYSHCSDHAPEGIVKHTEGPWELENETLLVWSYGFGVPITKGVENTTWHRALSWEERRANARLIAAAPETAAERDRLKAQNAELLKALEKIADPKMYDCANWVKIDHIKEFARKAIAAARESHE